MLDLTEARRPWPVRSLKQLWSPPVKKWALDRGLYGRSDYTRFVILGRSRVGSNLLRGLLNAHPQVAAFGEIFRDDKCLDWDHLGYFQTEGMRSLVQQDPVRFLEMKVLGRYPSSVRAVGFKLFYYHARDGAKAAVWPYLRARRDLKVIHLKRRNLLQTHLSRKRAALTDRWVNTSGQPDSSVVVRLDYEECFNDFVQTRAWEEQADRYFADHATVQVEYERLSSDYRTEARVIQEFLGLQPHPVSPSTFQQARQPLSAIISNYAELKQRFSGSAWSEFFIE